MKHLFVLCLALLLVSTLAGPTCPSCGSSGGSGAGYGGGAGGGAGGRAGGAASDGGAGGAGGGADLPPWCKFSNPFRSRARVDPICKELTFPHGANSATHSGPGLGW